MPIPGLSLVPTNQDRFGELVLAGLLLDVATGRIGRRPEMFRRKREQPEMIVVGAMATRRAGAAIAWFLKIVGGLLQSALPRSVLRKLRCGGHNVIGRPVIPCAARCIGIVAKQDKTLRSGRRVRPLQTRGQVFSVAGKAARNCRSVGTSSGMTEVNLVNKGVMLAR